MKRRFSDKEEREICVEYLSPKSRIEKMAEDRDCAIGTIFNILEKYSIPRRGRGKDKNERGGEKTKGMGKK